MKTELLLIPNALNGENYVVNLGKVKEIYGDNKRTVIGFENDETYLDVPFSTVFDLLEKYRENQQ